MVISTTGVMMPGPMSAAAMAKGFKERWAGIYIALGHGIVEFPTIALIALGFSTVLRDARVSIGIGLLGGALLLYMGASMVLSRKGAMAKMRPMMQKKKPDKKAKRKDASDGTDEPFPYHPLLAGIITTATNPYYFLWWATLGAALILNAVALGIAILVVMSVLHWSIDLGWATFLSYAVNNSKKVGDQQAFVAVFFFSGLIMLVFGVWFIGSAMWTVLGH